jgi:uncharacterized protein YqjF (DUF2071 family)
VSFPFSDATVPLVGCQVWRSLLFIHWPMPVPELRRLVPRQLELDLYDGQAYVSLIPFIVAESRPRGAPRALAMRFLETNLRTYVRSADDEPGIYFFSLDASSWLAASAARLLYGLPYFESMMSMRTEGGRTEYASRRHGAPDAQLDVDWVLGAPLGSAAVGSLDHFLVERYSLYVRRWGVIYRARVRHRPYPLHGVTVEHLSETLLQAAGLPAPTAPPLYHYSPGVDVEIFWLERVRTREPHQVSAAMLNRRSAARRRVGVVDRRISV